MEDCYVALHENHKILSNYDSYNYLSLRCDVCRIIGFWNYMLGDKVKGENQLKDAHSCAVKSDDKVRQLIVLLHMAATGFPLEFDEIELMFDTMTHSEKIHPLIDESKKQQLLYLLEENNPEIYAKSQVLLEREKAA